MEAKRNMSLCLIILLLFMIPSSHSKSIVKHLPGFSGELPFTLETGYVGVGKGEEVELFYYFVESQTNLNQDPLLLYLTGGPGTSAILPFFNQIGPLNFEYTNASRSDVELKVNPYPWTKTSNVIFIDLPVGTGFSYVKKWESSTPNSDSLAVSHAYDFMRKWLMDHPTFLDNPLYITGISYMGLVIPRVVSNIYNGNEHGVKPKLNLKGFLIVNPLTDKFINFNSRTEFANRVGLIEDELFETAKENCKGKYVYVDPNNTNNTLCLNSLRSISECIKGVNPSNILEPICNLQDPMLICRESIYPYTNIWANKKSVRQALHIRKGTVENFQYRNTSINNLYGKPDTVYYSHDIFSSLAYYKQLVTKNCHTMIIKMLLSIVLDEGRKMRICVNHKDENCATITICMDVEPVYSGDQDFTFPYVGTKQWMSSLNLKVKSPWKPWFLRTQVVGYEKTYSEAKFSLKFATIMGAGHSIAINKPEELLVIVETWLASHKNAST